MSNLFDVVSSDPEFKGPNSRSSSPQNLSFAPCWPWSRRFSGSRTQGRCGSRALPIKKPRGCHRLHRKFWFSFDFHSLTEGEQLWDGGVLLTAVQRRTVGSSETRRLMEDRVTWQKLGPTTEKSLQRFCFNDTHNFAKTPLELHVGLTLVMDAGFAVLASQGELVIHWRSKSRRERTQVNRSLQQHSQESGDRPHVHTIMRAQTSQNFGFLQ